METINDLLGYQNLKIYQNDDWFKFSLESVLLPNFVTINPSCKKILDMCTGNAPIPLILSTKTKNKIIGVEYQKDIYQLAKKTIKLDNLEKQITLINDDLKNLKKYYKGDTFDLITVNPPYFKNDKLSTKNIDYHKAIARHEITTTLEEIIKTAVYLLKNGGRLAMVHKTSRFIEVINSLQQHNINPKRIQFIYPKEDKESNLFMVEAIKSGKKDVIIERPLFIHNADGTYREEIKKIFQI